MKTELYEIDVFQTFQYVDRSETHSEIWNKTNSKYVTKSYILIEIGLTDRRRYSENKIQDTNS